MICIEIYGKNKINKITIKGHSQPDICASCSSIMYTSVNFLLNYDKQCINYIDDEITDTVVMDFEKHDNVIDIMINTMITMFEDLKEMSNENKQNVLIIRNKNTN